MKTILELPCYIDVDNTLCFSHEGNIEVDYYGEKRFIKEHHEHTSFLKSLKARGCYIIVHSHNGAEWAANVVKALGLEDYVDQCITKPFKIVDDEAPSTWLPHTIYMEPTPTIMVPYGTSMGVLNGR